MAPGDDDGEPVMDPSPRPLTRALVQSHLSVLGRNPFTLAHVYTTATLDELQLSDIEALREFPHLQVRYPTRGYNQPNGFNT